jgi:3-isopropylmalate/(R)-2-methylmalate dehydratase small subunit
MEAFTTLEAKACPLGLENVDTDQLIPARFMSRPRSAGYGDFLLHDLRGDGPDNFILDQPRYAGSRILVARRNFGTGSSREAAVYALVDYGIRAVIAPSFGDIFAGNACKNGLLAAVVTPEAAEALLDNLARADAPVLWIDLGSQMIAAAGAIFPFSVDRVRKMRLLNGWDDLDITRQYEVEIGQFRATRRHSAPWSEPSGVREV